MSQSKPIRRNRGLDSRAYHYFRKLGEGLTPSQALEALHVRFLTYSRWSRNDLFRQLERQSIDGAHFLKASENAHTRAQSDAEHQAALEQQQREQEQSLQATELRRQNSLLARVHPGRTDEEIKEMIENYTKD